MIAKVCGVKLSLLLIATCVALNDLINILYMCSINVIESCIIMKDPSIDKCL